MIEVLASYYISTWLTQNRNATIQKLNPDFFCLQVSWLRHRGNTIDLLTVGDTKYSGDDRINVSIVYDMFVSNIFILID